MSKERYRKLVRDNIPNILTREMKGRNPSFFPIHHLPPSEQEELWMAKLQEELDELKQAVASQQTAKILEEILDLYMFLAEFREAVSSDWNILYNQIARDKYRRNGGAKNHTVMEYDG